MIKRAILAFCALAALAVPAGAQDITRTPSSLDPCQAPIGSIFILTIAVANVATTGADVGSVAVPACIGDFGVTPGNSTQGAMLRVWSNGASGAVTGTVRTAATGGGSAIYTFTTVTPPAANALSRSTASLNTVILNSSTTTTLYYNQTASSATGTGNVDIPLERLP